MSLKILLADDSMTAQNMGKKILSEAGYEVVAVSNGAAAMKKIAADKFGLLILDVFMPGYTGLEVCEKVRAMAGYAESPVLLTVGKMEPFRAEESNKVKADGLIVKPFEASDLLATVQMLASKQAARSAQAELARKVKVAAPVISEQDASYQEWAASTPDETETRRATGTFDMPVETGMDAVFDERHAPGEAAAAGAEARPAEFSVGAAADSKWKPEAAGMAVIEPPAAPAGGWPGGAPEWGAAHAAEASDPEVELQVEAVPELEPTVAAPIEVSAGLLPELEPSENTATEEAPVATDPNLVDRTRLTTDFVTQFSESADAADSEEAPRALDLEVEEETPASFREPAAAELEPPRSMSSAAAIERELEQAFGSMPVRAPEPPPRVAAPEPEPEPEPEPSLEQSMEQSLEPAPEAPAPEPEPSEPEPAAVEEIKPAGDLEFAAALAQAISNAPEAAPEPEPSAEAPAEMSADAAGTEPGAAEVEAITRGVERALERMKAEIVAEIVKQMRK